MEGKGDDEIRLNELSDHVLPNPLLYDVVLAKVFSCGSWSLCDLLECRLVCKTWCLNSTLKNTIKDKSAVSLKSIQFHTSTTEESLPAYFLPSTGGPLYTRYNFEHVRYNNTLVQTVFKVLGASVEIIKLQLDLNQLNIHQFRNLLYNQLPNVQELEIYELSELAIFKKQIFPELPPTEHPKLVNLTRLVLQEVRKPILNFMTEFLATLPNLREVTLKSETCRDWENQQGIARSNSAIATSVIGALVNTEAYQTLKIFRCEKLTERHIIQLLQLGEKGLRLQVFELIAPKKSSEESFNRFLETQKDCLKELFISGDRNSGHEMSSIQFLSPMTHLVTLQLSRHPKTVLVPVHPVNYSKTCPRLKRMILLGRDKPGDQCHYFSPSQSVTHIVTGNSRTLLSLIGNNFPNLTNLDIRHPSGEFLVTLWKACANLHTLTMTLESSSLESTSILDEAFTGIEQVNFNKNRKRIRFQRYPSSSDNIPGQRIDQSILNLGALRTLKLLVEHDKESPPAISDDVAYFALQKMSYLQNLELYSLDWVLGHQECSFFTKKCQKDLIKSLENTIIRITPPATAHDVDEDDDNAILNALRRGLLFQIV